MNHKDNRPEAILDRVLMNATTPVNPTPIDMNDIITKKELAKKLHEWYLEATEQDGAKYNYEAVVPYEDLPEGSKMLDLYIAEKLLTTTLTEVYNSALEASALKGEYKVEHCSEPECPECYKEAYQRGREDEAIDHQKDFRGDESLKATYRPKASSYGKTGVLRCKNHTSPMCRHRK